jgi:hypothetical protein
LPSSPTRTPTSRLRLSACLNSQGRRSAKLLWLAGRFGGVAVVRADVPHGAHKGVHIGRVAAKADRSTSVWLNTSTEVSPGNSTHRRVRLRPFPAVGRTALHCRLQATVAFFMCAIRIHNPSFCSMPDQRRSAVRPRKQAKKDEHDSLRCRTRQYLSHGARLLLPVHIGWERDRTARKRPQLGQ